MVKQEAHSKKVKKTLSSVTSSTSGLCFAFRIDALVVAIKHAENDWPSV